MLFEGAKDKQFFALLLDAAQNIVSSAGEFGRMVSDLDRSSEYAARLKEMELKGDKCTHSVIAMLNKEFITPLEREDILALTVKLDDVTDNLEAAASRMHLYKIRGQNRFIEGFAKVIARQAEQIVSAMEKLQTKNLAAMRENAVQINLLENEADVILREAIEELFDQEKDAITIIKLKEIYETLETVTDRAEDVANTLESVVMKNS